MAVADLKEAMDLHLADLIAQRLAARLREQQQSEWNTVVAELVATRKTHERVKQTLVDMQQHMRRLERLLNETEAEVKHRQELMRQAATLVNDALKDLGAGE